MVEYTITLGDLTESDVSIVGTDTPPTVPMPSGNGWTLCNITAGTLKMYYMWCRGEGATTVTANFTITSEEMILVDATSGPITIILPLPANITKIVIKKIDSSSNIVTIIPAGSETIDGQPSYQISTQYTAIDLVTDDINWFII